MSEFLKRIAIQLGVPIEALSSDPPVVTPKRWIPPFLWHDKTLSKGIDNLSWRDVDPRKDEEQP